MKSIDGYLKEGYERWKDKPYIWEKQEGIFVPYTYGCLAETVWRLSLALESLGLSGNGVIYGDNSLEWMAVDLCLMGYAGVSVPIDRQWTLFDVRNCLNSLDISMFFYSEDKDQEVEQLREEYPGIRFFSMEKDLEGLLWVGAEREKQTGLPVGEENLEKTVKILFTSGTTAFPKAIPLSQRNLFANWDTLFARTPMTETDRSLIFLPLNHVYSGVANFLYTMISGMNLYLCNDLRELIPDLLDVRPTVICTVPVIMARMIPAMEGNAEVLAMLRGIRFLYCGGSPAGREMKAQLRALGIRLIEAYGTTETASVIALEKWEDPNLSSNGVVFENLKVKIQEAGPDGVGEILVSGDSRTAGYLNCQENSAYFDEEGYYHTGDLGSLDAEGHLYVKGRKRRTLDQGNGKNVYADELEALLLNDPQVKKASVYLSEGKITASVLTEVPEESVQELLLEVNEKLPGFKRIAAIRINQSFTGSWFKE